MTMSTYKSLGGPAGGLVLTDDPALAERLEAVAFPGLTANFDAGRVAALGITLADWREHGAAHAAETVATARALCDALRAEGLPVHGETESHALAVRAPEGGQRVARRLARSGLYACGIGLPLEGVEGDANGLRLGTPEAVRRGMGPGDMGELAALIARAWAGEDVGPAVAAFRAPFGAVRFAS